MITARCVALDSTPPQFIDAATSAVKEWRFMPLEMVENRKTIALPYSDTSTFIFKQVDGVAVIE